MCQLVILYVIWFLMFRYCHECVMSNSFCSVFMYAMLNCFHYQVAIERVTHARCCAVSLPAFMVLYYMLVILYLTINLSIFLLNCYDPVCFVFDLQLHCLSICIYLLVAIYVTTLFYIILNVLFLYMLCMTQFEAYFSYIFLNLIMSTSVILCYLLCVGCRTGHPCAIYAKEKLLALVPSLVVPVDR